MKYKDCVKLKVLYIIPYDWGAMPQYTAELVNSVSNYAEVIVIGSTQLNKTYFNEKIKIVNLFSPLNFTLNNFVQFFSVQTLKGFLSFKNIKAIKDINPDIIHLTTPIFPPLAVYLKIYKYDVKYPIIYTKHGILSNSGFKEKILELYILGFFEKLIAYKNIIVHTQHDKDDLIKFGKIRSKTINIIPHGIYSFFLRYGNKMKVEKNCILFFGNIREYKGLRYLIQAVPLVLEEIPNLKVIIAGEGDISEFSEYIEKHKNVFEIHNDFIPDTLVSELFQRSEIVVMPYTKMSGQSGILNVALAYNKPIIASDVGGIGEVIKNGINGFLIPPKDSDALANSILKVLKDDKLQNQMKENILNSSQNLSWNNIAKTHIQLYEKIVLEKNDAKK